MTIIFGYLGALAAGTILGLLGGGGSILIVPILVYLFSVPPSQATAYSLFVVGFASLIGAIKYSKKGLVEYKTAAIFAVPAFSGVAFSRKFIVPNLPEVILNIGSFQLEKDAFIMIVFAVVMLFASFSMIKKKSGHASEEDDSKLKLNYNYKRIVMQGLGVGVLTGFVGAGGGFLIIPALVLLARLPMKLAVGTSLLIISINSLIGFLADLTVNQSIDWTLLLSITSLAVVGIFVGTYFSQFVPGKKLKPIFGWFVLFMGIFILIKQML